MSLTIKLEKRIRDKEIEIQALEIALKEARAYLQAVRDVLRLSSKPSEEKNYSNNTNIRAGSILEQVYTILNKAGQPMKIMDILKAMGKNQTTENRQSLVGSINSYARKGKLFTKTGPNTFGLIEWQQKKSDEENKLPDTFGLQ